MSRRIRGTGSLTKLPDGRKKLIYTLRDPYTQKVRKIQVTAKSEAQCKVLLEQRLQEINEDKSEAERITVTELCKKHLEYQYKQGELKESSRDRNMCTINNNIECMNIGEMLIDSIRPAQIEDHFHELLSAGKLSASSIEKVKYVLDAAFKWAVSREMIDRNPMDPVRKSIDKRLDAMRAKSAADADVHILTEEQEERFRREALIKTGIGTYKYPSGLFCVLLLETGMRCGEMIALRWKDYDKKSGVLCIERGRSRVRKDTTIDATRGKLQYQFKEHSTKNQRARYIQLTEKACGILDEIYKQNEPKTGPDDYICLSRNGNPRSVTDMEHGAKTIYKAAGISKEEASGVHIFRRTFATRKSRSGWTLSAVAAYLGDLESTVSRHYIADRDYQVVGGKRVTVVRLPDEK